MRLKRNVLFGFTDVLGNFNSTNYLVHKMQKLGNLTTFCFSHFSFNRRDRRTVFGMFCIKLLGNNLFLLFSFSNIIIVKEMITCYILVCSTNYTFCSHYLINLKPTVYVNYCSTYVNKLMGHSIIKCFGVLFGLIRLGRYIHVYT